MASTLTNILVHVTFSTRLRVPLILAAREDALYSFIGGVCKRHSSPLLAAGGTSDHVHLLISLHKTVALAKLLLEVKRDSSRWMKSGPGAVPDFVWQDGYFGFSVSASNSEAVRRYIGNGSRAFKPEGLGVCAPRCSTPSGLKNILFARSVMRLHRDLPLY